MANGFWEVSRTFSSLHSSFLKIIDYISHCIRFTNYKVTITAFIHEEVLAFSHHCLSKTVTTSLNMIIHILQKTLFNACPPRYILTCALFLHGGPIPNKLTGMLIHLTTTVGSVYVMADSLITLVMSSCFVPLTDTVANFPLATFRINHVALLPRLCSRR